MEKITQTNFQSFLVPVFYFSRDVITCFTRAWLPQRKKLKILDCTFLPTLNFLFSGVGSRPVEMNTKFPKDTSTFSMSIYLYPVLVSLCFWQLCCSLFRSYFVICALSWRFTAYYHCWGAHT